MFRIATAMALMLSAGMAQAGMTVDLLPPWDGKKIPKGQHCQLQGGKGATPPMQVAGIPAGTVMLVVQYNDKSYKPLSSKGGHGTIGYPVKGASAKLPAVPGMTANLPGGVRVMAPARSTGEYASKGYLPPCSGGRGNSYEAVVQAVGADGKVLERVKLKIGRY